MQAIILFLLQNVLLIKAFQTSKFNADPQRWLVALVVNLLFVNKRSASIL
jgi:hypothetical protein